MRNKQSLKASLLLLSHLLPGFIIFYLNYIQWRANCFTASVNPGYMALTKVKVLYQGHLTLN